MIKEVRKFFVRVGIAFSGLKEAFQKERNLQIQFAVAILTILLFIMLKVSFFEYLIMLVFIGGVISFELMNTAIERVVDLVTTEHHPLAKSAKDIAAGGVLFFSFIAVIAGILIIWRHLS